jgi:hypothetical protein
MDADFIEGLVGRSVLIFDQPCRSRALGFLTLIQSGESEPEKLVIKRAFLVCITSMGTSGQQCLVATAAPH